MSITKYNRVIVKICRPCVGLETMEVIQHHTYMVYKLYIILIITIS